MAVKHFLKVDLPRVRATFCAGKQHRAKLHIPFLERTETRTLCVIGQNPSAADERQADKTVHFLERYVFERLPQYGQMLMLNLYSRVDTEKTEKVDLIHPECERLLQEAIAQHQDFLVVFGRLRNERAYKFPGRVHALQPLFVGKNVYKFNIDVPYAPHPGNPRIVYQNTKVSLVKYDFGDLAPAISAGR